MKADFDNYLQAVSAQICDALRELVPDLSIAAFHYFYNGCSVSECIDGLMSGFLT